MMSQIDDPVDTIVITDKWDKDSAGAVTDSWIESFNGDFDYDNGAGYDHTRMFKAGNRHQGFTNCLMFDGHAKALNASTIQQSKDLSGCSLIYKYPVPPNGSALPPVMTTTVTSAAAGEPNICSPSVSPNFVY